MNEFEYIETLKDYREEGLKEGLKKGLQQGEKRGVEKERQAIVLKLKKKGFSDKEIADILDGD